MHKGKLKAIKILILEYKSIVESYIQSSVITDRILELSGNESHTAHHLKTKSRIDRALINIEDELK